MAEVPLSGFPGGSNGRLPPSSGRKLPRQARWRCNDAVSLSTTESVRRGAPSEGSAVIPEPTSQGPVTSRGELDAALDVLRNRARSWVELPLDERIRLLDQLVSCCAATADDWVRLAVRAKQITPGTSAEAEEWFGGPYCVLRNLRLLRQSLREIARNGVPTIPGGVSERANGQLVAKVFPASLWDRAFFAGFSAEVWMDPGVVRDELEETMAVSYHQQRRPGVALVLGAGNVSSIGPMDALYKLFVEHQVVVLKMNPVNAYLSPVLTAALAPLIDGGYVRIVHGGAEEGAYLCDHDGVDSIHITGSDRTHDAIVFGLGEEGRRRKAEHRPQLDKPITSELGNVSPVIVVPGPWSLDDLRYQGINIASQLTNNAGFNCNAARVLVTRKHWFWRPHLRDAIAAALERAPQRLAYYPGAVDRFARFADVHPELRIVGEQRGRVLPWAMVEDVPPHHTDDICFRSEAFCGVFAETGLDAEDPISFLEQATDFVNNHVWGTLSASLIVHPRSLRDPAVAAAVERAIGRLRYGTVAVNHWPAVGYGMGTTTWGAFPGHSLDNIQSGRGVVHNTLMFDRPQKSVIRGPFRVWPTPPWMLSHRSAHRLARQITLFEAKPSALRSSLVLANALRG